MEISSDNLAPTAVATVDFSLAIVGTTSNFDGTGSTDPESDALTYSWNITAAPLDSTATLGGAITDSSTLTTDAEGSYELTLTVSDFIGAGAPATVEVVATTPANYAEIKIVDACAVVEALTSNQVQPRGTRMRSAISSNKRRKTSTKAKLTMRFSS